PGTQTRKPRWARRSERAPVVHADNRRVTVASEQPHKDSPHRLPSLIGQQADAQQIAAVLVAHGQRFHPLPILCSKPAFEIHRPYLVAATGLRQLSTAYVRPTPRTPTNTATEFHLLEPSTNRPHRRNTLPSVLPGQSSPQFPTPPTAMSSTQLPKTFQPFRAR